MSDRLEPSSFHVGLSPRGDLVEIVIRQDSGALLLTVQMQPGIAIVKAGDLARCAEAARNGDATAPPAVASQIGGEP